MDVRSRIRGRETSPDRAKVCMQPKVVKPIRKIQVVYYLTRNGQLEHPHYMEVTHVVNQPLRLRGVSTDELEDQETNTQQQQQPQKTEPSNSILSEKQTPVSKNSTSQRFEDGDPIGTESDSAPSRNSVLLQLISCGGNLAVTKAKNVPAVKKSENLHRGVLCKSAVKVAEDDQMISCMSENPRFGNLQAEEKEYFSGSIIESMNSENRVVAEPMLKKSNSYNEERSCSKAGIIGEAVEEEKKDKTVKGKCIPRKKSSSKQTRK
ncbi:hypothetical protein COLO4_09925 [Corchorus olitorius]|uniref:SOSEKI DIX-like domain-containing protein n=1 Tax=Corchorus olitorius TaxID=93759 RepID=A0A1R3KAL6_9ROSI|nr:hypothetical protein COLO4_09925 [Corchorus olitorius]